MTDLHQSWQQQRDELFVALQRLLPQHLLSRWLGKLADCETPWLKDRLIRLAMAHFDIDLREAELESPADYPSFNAFFTRKLKATARPIDSAPNSLISPADGTISQIGQIGDGQLIQAKGRCFSIGALLACPDDISTLFANGSFATIYLSPRDYHRVHMPVDGELIATTYVPGQLFSVNDATARQIDNLFARNERLVCHFDTAFGKLAVVLVGALFVAGIETQWQKEFLPGRCQTTHFDKPLRFAKGDQLGAFKFGSTVVMASENAVVWQDVLFPGAACKMGRALGTLDS